MGKISTFIKLLRTPSKLFVPLGKNGLLRWIPDRLYLQIAYRCETGKKLNLDNPQTYTEKLQWLKLNDRNPSYTRLVDKYDVREYVAERIGKGHLVDLIGCYNTVDEIEFDKLPHQFVLKTTHGSTWNIICFDKHKLDIKDAKCKLSKWMRQSIYEIGREWPYKSLKPRIICEKLLIDQNGSVPDDYKIFCFYGVPKVIALHEDRFRDHKETLYDIEWNKLDAFSVGLEVTEFEHEKPQGYDEMVRIAGELSAGLRHVRIDLFNIRGKIYFSEITFFDGSGFCRLEPDDFDKLLGSWIPID